MTTSDLPARLVASPAFRWMAGMRLLITEEDGSQDGFRVVRPDRVTPLWSHEQLDLSDPATAGCLLALLVEQGFEAVTLDQVEGERGWQVILIGLALNLEVFFGPTPGEALALALIAVGGGE